MHLFRLMSIIIVEYFSTTLSQEEFGDFVANFEEQILTTESTVLQETWVDTAVLDVAYILRKHKFNNRDIRYRIQSPNSFKLYQLFPDPPLKNIHNQVQKYCDESFLECLKYLWETSFNFPLTRAKNPFENRDSTTGNMMNKNISCTKLLEDDSKIFEPFKHAMDKFQWLTSASYYMCWYSNKRMDDLKYFRQSCDNYATCLDDKDSFSNNDIRANMSNPFSCAIYSFCPDPCCSNRLLKDFKDCHNIPCPENSCRINLSDNSDWGSILLNYWNISCNCAEEGKRWSSQSGLCIDIDECFEETDRCDKISETCFNIENSYECICAFGYKFNDDKVCEVDNYLLRTLNILPEYMQNGN